MRMLALQMGGGDSRLNILLKKGSREGKGVQILGSLGEVYIVVFIFNFL